MFGDVAQPQKRQVTRSRENPMKLLKYHFVWGPNNTGVVFLYSKHGLEIIMVIKRKDVVGNFQEERKRWKYVWFLIYLTV